VSLCDGREQAAARAAKDCVTRAVLDLQITAAQGLVDGGKSACVVSGLGAHASAQRLPLMTWDMASRW
jgi:hypothetical protein